MEPTPAPEMERPSVEWAGSIASLFELLTQPGQVKEEEGPEYRVRAVHLRVSVRRSTVYYPRLELRVSRKPAPADARAVALWQRDNERLLQDAKTIFGVGWMQTDEADPGDVITRTYIELLPGEKAPGQVPCRCGAKELCSGIPARCLATLRAQSQQTIRSLRKPTREIPTLFGGHDQ